MNTFPHLSTGAVTQYPLGMATGQGSQDIRFLDGTDQRFRTQGRMLRRWQIRLDLLNENEIESLETFFNSQLGSYSAFVFPDPYSGTPVPNCVFGADTFLSDYEGVDVNRVSFWVVETNG
jgi:hypothetical protein